MPPTRGDDSDKPDALRVTDRRRFTETGDMRDGEDAREPVVEPAAPPRSEPSAPPRPDPGAPVEAGYSREPSARESSAGRGGSRDGAGSRADAEGGASAGAHGPQGPVPGVFDIGIQAVFYIFWQSAMVALGAGAEGSTAPVQVDLAQAREAIALLKLLEEKTAGNLDAEEAETLGQFLHDAQLRYVQVARATGAIA